MTLHRQCGSISLCVQSLVILVWVCSLNSIYRHRCIRGKLCIFECRSLLLLWSNSWWVFMKYRGALRPFCCTPDFQCGICLGHWAVWLNDQVLHSLIRQWIFRTLVWNLHELSSRTVLTSVWLQELEKLQMAALCSSGILDPISHQKKVTIEQFSWLCWVNSLDFGQANEIVPRHPSVS